MSVDIVEENGLLLSLLGDRLLTLGDKCTHGTARCVSECLLSSFAESIRRSQNRRSGAHGASIRADTDQAVKPGRGTASKFQRHL
jgi:hypothetical protein